MKVGCGGIAGDIAASHGLLRGLATRTGLAGVGFILKADRQCGFFGHASGLRVSKMLRPERGRRDNFRLGQRAHDHGDVSLDRAERVIERVVQRDAVVTETDREKSVTPAARPRPRWYVGAGWIAGAVAREAWAARIGVSNGRLDVGYRYGRQGNSHGVEVALRF